MDKKIKIKGNRNIILPNMITLLGMLSGVLAIASAADGYFFRAAVLVLIAAVFDGLDGKVARLVNGTSEFGVQLDSLSDLISFGVAPAFIIYTWQLVPFKQVGIMAMFLFMACGALRLARFNVQTKVISNVFFVGLPIPAAASILASSVLFIYHLGLNSVGIVPYAYLVLVFLLAFLMVSTMPYYSFKNLDFIKAHPFNTIVILVIFLFLIGLRPQITIFAALILYMLSGLVLFPISKRLSDKINNQKEAEGL